MQKADEIKDGSYWINDKNRYGFEVVRVVNGTFYRFGMEQAFSVRLFVDKYEFIKADEPATRK